jgi:ribonuclease BN (tRNA processing enzyme)
MSGTEPEEENSSSILPGARGAGKSSQAEKDFVVRFWGVRGSYPVASANTRRVGGNTSCVEVRVGGHEIILDAGTGLIPLGQVLRQRLRAIPPTVTILFSHFHYDHILGLPFFDPLYQAGATLHLAGPRMAGKSFTETLYAAMTAPYFPVDLREVPSTCQFYTLEPGDYLQWHAGMAPPHVQRAQFNGGTPEGMALSPGDVRITFLHSAAHPLHGCLVSRIEYGGRSLVYATDVEEELGDNQQLAHFARGADILIHDAQYREEDYVSSKRGFGHSTPHMATAMARAAGVKRLLLFHHDPEYDDAALEQLQDTAQREFPETSLAFEGLEISLL